LNIGIDIAKETHVAGAVNYRGIQLGRTLSFNNDHTGFEKLMRWVRDLQKAKRFKSNYPNGEGDNYESIYI
jgi:transposase